MTSNPITFAIDPLVIHFAEEGVDTGFKKEFLASAVNCVLTAVVSGFTLLCNACCRLLVSRLCMRIAGIVYCIAKPPFNTSVKTVTQQHTASVFSKISCFHFHNSHAAITTRC